VIMRLIIDPAGARRIQFGQKSVARKLSNFALECPSERSA
jgi:hypothetical protein